MFRKLTLVVAALAVAVGAGPAAGDPHGPAVATPAVPVAGEEGSDGTASRPYGLKIPQGYDGGEAPLVVLLHGYGSDGAAHDAYFGLGALAEREGYLLATPEGTKDPAGNRFWNATDACCDFFNQGVDDLGYLDAMLEEITGRYNVDRARVYLVGHSNGAFMAHRFACDRSGRIAAIVTLAGMQWHDPARCPASSPVSVLHVHGRNDQIVLYRGGSMPRGRYPGAVATVEAWAEKNACSGRLAPTGRRLDLDTRLPGEETVVERYTGCTGVDVELWTIEGGGHIPAFDDRWAESIWEFMESDRKS